MTVIEARWTELVDRFNEIADKFQVFQQPDEVAWFLAEHQVRGICNSTLGCAIAEYATVEMGLTEDPDWQQGGLEVRVYPTRMALVEREPGRHSVRGVMRSASRALPEAVEGFIDGFDKGRYPELTARRHGECRTASARLVDERPCSCPLCTKDAGDMTTWAKAHKPWMSKAGVVQFKPSVLTLSAAQESTFTAVLESIQAL